MTRAADFDIIYGKKIPAREISQRENGAAARIAAEWKPSEDPSVSPEAAATFDAIDECKAVDDGRIYLVNASGGGVAGIDAKTMKAKWVSFLKPYGAGPHSCTALPDGRIAVAHSTDIDKLQIVDPRQHPFEPEKQLRKDVMDLRGGHGVHWDAKRGTLFALGYTNLFELVYHPETVSVEVKNRWSVLPVCVDPWNHDLVPDGRGGYHLTNPTAVCHFDPDSGVF